MSVAEQETILQFKGTIQNEKIVLTEPIDLPDGTPVQITASKNSTPVPEDGWDNSPEGIAAWLKWYNSLKPTSNSPIEDKDNEEWLKKMNDLAMAKMEQETGDIFK